MKKPALALLLLTLVLALPAASRAADLCAAPVDTAEGPVLGKMDGAACSWKGIPYAGPPLDRNRFRAPQPALKRTRPFEAYQFSPSCPANESITSGGKSLGFSEDCLTLNVWRPNKSGVFPVMVWIHGGGFTQGSSAYELYNGSRLAAERDLVIVSINYRLGALGFLALPGLAAEDKNKSTGNYGILDQVAALKWVRDNIAGFGGDPNTVTIFGHSAGGTSVTALLVSPAAAGLYHRAINMSGPADMVATMDEGYAPGAEIVSKLKCEGPDQLDCLRAKPFKAFLKTGGGSELLNGGVAFSPHADGYAVAGMPLELMAAGQWNRVPLMTGTARDELDLFTIAVPGIELMPRSGINWLAKKLAGDVAADFQEYYSYKDYRRPYQLFAAMGTDFAFVSRTFVQAQSAATTGPVWLYRFDWDQTTLPSRIGAYHGIDVPFVFGSYTRDLGLMKIITTRKSQEKARDLSETLMTYYANFARTGDPNGEGVPQWPAYTPDKRDRIIFDTEIKIEPLSDREVERMKYLAGKKLGGAKAD